MIRPNSEEIGIECGVMPACARLPQARCACGGQVPTISRSQTVGVFTSTGRELAEGEAILHDREALGLFVRNDVCSVKEAPMPEPTTSPTTPGKQATSDECNVPHRHQGSDYCPVVSLPSPQRIFLKFLKRISIFNYNGHESPDPYKSIPFKVVAPRQDPRPTCGGFGTNRGRERCKGESRPIDSQGPQEACLKARLIAFRIIFCIIL